MTRVDEFFAALADGVIAAGGTAVYTKEQAMIVAEEAWVAMQEIGMNAFPCLYEHPDGLRFVYQWDLRPAVITIMIWVDVMWCDMARIYVPRELQF